jgi:YbgC/YbaW family acyl-CoA thioester hydrolase
MKSAPRTKTPIEVMFFDTDCGGVVSNIAYLRFVETARTALTSKLGMSPQDMTESMLFPAVTRTEIDYRKPARLGDKLSVIAELESLGTVRIGCRFEICREADSAVLATCRQTLALVQLPRGRPQRIPESWLENWPHLKGNPE